MEEKDRQKIIDNVEQSFIERNNNCVTEKISYCISRGMTKDEACHTVIQVVKKLSDNLILFPFKPTQNIEWS